MVWWGQRSLLEILHDKMLTLTHKMGGKIVKEKTDPISQSDRKVYIPLYEILRKYKIGRIKQYHTDIIYK